MSDTLRRAIVHVARRGKAGTACHCHRNARQRIAKGYASRGYAAPRKPNDYRAAGFQPGGLVASRPPETVRVPSGRFPNTKPVHTDSITVRPRQSSVTESAACSRLLEGSSHDHLSPVQALRQEKPTTWKDPRRFIQAARSSRDHGAKVEPSGRPNRSR